MANKPFDREIINVRERPFSSDINMSEYYADLSLRETIKSLISPRVSVSNADPSFLTEARFLGASFKVVPTSPVSGSVVITKGLGFVGSIESETNINNVLGLNDTSQLKPLVLSSNKTVDVPAAHPLFDRIDIIEVRSEYLTTDSQSRDIFNTVTGVFNPVPVAKTFTWALDQSLGYVLSPSNSTEGIGYKQGVAHASPTAPSTTAGYTKIAEIYVNSGSSSYGTATILEYRKIASQYGSISISGKLELPEMADFNETNLSILQPNLVSLNAPPGLVVSSRIVSSVIDPDDLVAGAKKTYEICVFSPFESANFNASLIGSYEILVLANNVTEQRLRQDSITIETLGAGGQLAYNTTGSPSVNIYAEQQCVKFRFTVQAYVDRIVSSGYVAPTLTNPGIVDFSIVLK